MTLDKEKYLADCPLRFFQPFPRSRSVSVSRRKNVQRLVAVYDSGCVGGGESLSGIHKDAQDVLGATRPNQPLAQRGTLDKLHCDEDLIERDTDVEDRHDIRVRQPRHRLRFS